MRFAFDRHDGFIAVDDDARVAAYAYPTSTYATQAKKRPKGTASEMLAGSPPGGELGRKITEDHYLHLSAELSAIRTAQTA